MAGLDARANCTDIVADMQGAGGINAGKYSSSHFLFISQRVQ